MRTEKKWGLGCIIEIGIFLPFLTLILIFVFRLLYTQPTSSIKPSSHLSFFIIGTLVYAGAAGIVLGIVGGLVQTFFPERWDKYRPFNYNLTFWDSFRKTLAFALVLGLYLGLPISLLFDRPTGLFVGLLSVLLLPLYKLNFDISSVAYQLMLRFWLWRTGTLPWNIVTFLNEATERLLLRKVGKDYGFIHALLLDHFASLEKHT
jgi:hypothetical protein